SSAMGSLLIPSDVRVETEFKLLPLTEPGSGTAVSSDGKTVCYWSGPRLHCLHVPSYRPAGAWHLGRSSPCTWSIRDVKFFSLDSIQHLLVAAEAIETADCHLVMLQCGRSAALKRLRLPYRASCLAVLAMPDCLQPASVCGPLLGAFAGCAAIGCHSGHVMLIDLRLDDDELGSDLGFGGGDSDESGCGGGGGASSATGPESAAASASANTMPTSAAAQAMPMSTLAVVASAPAPADAVARLRDAACDSGGHLYCLLDDNLLTSSACFKYKKTNGEVWQAFSADSVSVTALHYSKLTASLLVGFSFGGAQIWRLVDGFHEFTCKIEFSSPPVSHFVLLKADDDPMNLLYLWICRGSREVSALSTIVLYQLKYRDRKSLSSSQSESSSNGSDPVACVHYDTLVSAGVSFSQCLALSGGESTNSRLIHCDNFFTRQSINNDEDLSRAYFVWTECSGSILHVGVFDLNRWYQCQLPRTAKYSLRSLHPYFAVHRLELQRHLLSSGLRLLGGPAPFVLAATVVPDSVTQFQPGLNPRPGAAPAEQLFYPASLGYRIRLHCPPHALLLRCDGAQRAHLDLIGRLSPDSLMARADELADRCVQLGLLSPPPSSAAESDDVVGENDSDARRRLLTVCLEHIRDDALPTLGCGQYSALVIDWLWASVRRYKHLLDSATAGLFSVDNQQDDVDEDEVIKDVDADAVADDSRVVQLVTLLDRLDELLRRLLDCRPASSAAVADLRCRADAVSRLCAYARRLQWCARARLLPPGRLAPVFADLEAQVADARRSRALVVDCLIERLFSYDAAPAGHCVDIDSVGAKAESPVSMTYPPADARHLLESVFLRAPAGCDPRLQHCLFAYLLMDLQALLEDADDAEELTEQWDGYLSVSGQPASLARWANLLWSLDHSLWPEALSLLDDPDLSRPLFPGLADGVVSAVAELAPNVAARCLIRFRPHAQVSPALAVRVLLASGRPDLALDLIIRPIGDSAERADLLARLLNECAASDRWRGKLFAGIHWRQEELPGLADFAAKSGCQQIKEQLVAHLLLTGRYAEAAQLSDRLPVCDAASAARKRLVDIVLDSLPRVQRDLLRLEIAQQAAGTSYIAALPTRRTVDPKPLAAQPSGFASLAGVNPFGTSVTTEKLFANVVATREQERQAWLKAVQSDRPAFFRGLLSNVFMTPTAAAAHASTNNARPPLCSLSTIKKRVCSPVLTNPRSAKFLRRDPADNRVFAEDGATMASPRVRDQCNQLLRTPCRLGNSHQKQQQQQLLQQSQSQQRHNFSSANRPIVSILRKTRTAGLRAEASGNQHQRSHSPAGRLRFADAVEDASPEQRQPSDSQPMQRRATPGPPPPTAASPSPAPGPSPIPIDLDETSFDSPSYKREQSASGPAAAAGSKSVGEAKLSSSRSFDVEMAEATVAVGSELTALSSDDSGTSATKPPRPQGLAVPPKINSVDDVSQSNRGSAAVSPASSSDVFVTPEDTSPVVERPTPPPPESVVSVPFCSPAVTAASPVASMARSDLLGRRSVSPGAASAAAPRIESEQPSASSFTFAKPLPNIRLAAVQSAAVDTASASSADFVFSPPTKLGRARFIRSAQRMSPPLQQPTQRVSPPLQQPTQRVSPPLQQPTQRVSPPLQQPTQRVSPPLQQPTQQVSPPLQQSTQQVSPPLQQSTQQVSPPLQQPTQRVSSQDQQSPPLSPQSQQQQSPSVISVVVVRRPAGSPIVVHSTSPQSVSPSTGASRPAADAGDFGQKTVVQEVSMDISSAGMQEEAVATADERQSEQTANISGDRETESHFETDSFFSNQPPVAGPSASRQEDVDEEVGEEDEEEETISTRRSVGRRGRRRPRRLSESTQSSADAEKPDAKEKEADNASKEENAEDVNTEADAASTVPKTRRSAAATADGRRKTGPKRAVGQRSRRRRVSKQDETVAAAEEAAASSSSESDSDDKAEAEQPEAEDATEETMAASPEVKYQLRRRVSMSAPPTPTSAAPSLAQPPPQQKLRRSSRRASVQSVDEADFAMPPPPPPPQSQSTQQSASASTAATVADEEDLLNTSASSLDSEMSIASAPAGPSIRRSNRLRGRRQQPPRAAAVGGRRASVASAAAADDLPALPEEATAASPDSVRSSSSAVVGSRSAVAGRRRRGRPASRAASSEFVGGSPDSAASGASSSLSVRTDIVESRQSSRRQRRRGGDGDESAKPAAGRRIGLRSRKK
ncbi:hypothetical protein BOX15_Mlig012018g1, partial [Macrostomum lignano]